MKQQLRRNDYAAQVIDFIDLSTTLPLDDRAIVEGGQIESTAQIVNGARAELPRKGSRLRANLHSG